MKNSQFVAIIIAIVTPIVKLFPAWALKYTKKSNKYAEKFQLSAIEEKKYLLKHPQSAAWVVERIWHLQTRKYFCKPNDIRPELLEIFISVINNGTIFDVAYEIVPMDAIRAKSYTLDAERIIKVCNDNVNYLYILADKQPQSFTVDVVKKLASNRQEAYFSYLFTKCNWEKLMELDIILFEEAKKSKVAESCLSFLMGLNDYQPNLSAEQLTTLGDKFEEWCQKANALLVIQRMTEYWQEHKDFQHIFNMLKRLTKVEASQKRNDIAQSLLKILPPDLSEESIYLLLENGIACPSAFKFLLDKKDEININYNLSLCISQNVEGKIVNSAFERFSIEQKRTLLSALANDGILSKEMLNKAPNETIKKELLMILEEKAQIKWFKPLLRSAFGEQDINILENYYKQGKIYKALQDLTFQDSRWVEIFVKHNWYDNKHTLMLMQSVFIDNILEFIKRYGVTQEQFEALLTGTNAHLAPQARLFLKPNNEDNAFCDGK